jgi:thiol-disulfide isomerase/thioredoxin
MVARIGIVVGIVVIGLAAYQVGTRWQVSRVTRASRGQNGAANGLLSELRPGVPGIVYFWSPDCPPCLTVQKPALAALQEELGDDGLQVLAVNVYERPDLAESWGVLSLPTTFVVDGQGEPRGINNGVAREDKLHRQVTDLTS